MRVVTIFRPFPVESQPHQKLGEFDWVDAIQMLSTSVERACDCETVTLTDVDTELPVPSFQFKTKERRLMLWILEVSRAYLASKHFDRDTVMVSPDMLVFKDLRPYFQADLGILVRTGKFENTRPVLNSVQWWSHAAKSQLVGWYDAAIAYAKQLPDDVIAWGADTEPFVQLLMPLWRGAVAKRGGISVAFLPCEEIVEAYKSGVFVPSKAVTDFRYNRKRFLREYYDATIGAEVNA